MLISSLAKMLANNAVIEGISGEIECGVGEVRTPDLLTDRYKRFVPERNKSDLVFLFEPTMVTRIRILYF